jgi:hypothetical protein
MYKDKSEVIENNHKVFKGKWDGYIRDNFIQAKQPSPTASPTTYNLQPKTSSSCPRPLTATAACMLSSMVQGSKLRVFPAEKGLY